MNVTCEGCESTFHVGDGLIKPSGSRVRCSKCRHVFTAYAPAQGADAGEPLTLTDELPAVPASSDRTVADGIEPKWDALFASIDTAEPGLPAADDAPELLNVDDLLGSAEGGGEGAQGAGFEADAENGLDMDLDLDVIDEAVEDDGMAADGRAPATGGAGDGAAGLGGALDLDIHDFLADDDPAGRQEDGEILPPALDELEIDMGELAGLEEAAGAIPEPALPDAEAGNAESELDLDLDALSLEVSERDGEELAQVTTGGGGGAAGAGWKDPGKPAATAMDDLGLDLEGEAGVLEPVDDSGPQADGATGGVDELDLSDLEDMLEEAEATPAEGTKPGGAPADRDLDLLSEILPEDQTPGEAEKLDPASLATALENGAAAAPEPEEDDLDLGFLDEMEQAEPETASGSKAAADELDFSDMEDAFDSAEEPGSDKSREELELELLFDDELSGAPASREPGAARDADGPLLDIETLLGDDGVAQDERVSVDAGDMEIEIEPLRRGLEDRLLDEAAASGAHASRAPAATTQAATDQFSTDEFTHTGFTGATDILQTERVAATPPATESPARTGSRKTVWALLAVLLLAVAALVVPRGLGIYIPYLSDIQIPVIDDLLKSEPQDPHGNLKLTPVEATISADFIDNPAAGRLCVITGQVRNDYGHPRSHLHVTVRLFTKDKVMAKSATVFAGNLLSKQDLARLDLAAINARPNLKTGANDVNVAVPPGKTVPFMVVLSKLPADADEYSVEVGGSTK